PSGTLCPMLPCSGTLWTVTARSPSLRCPSAALIRRAGSRPRQPDALGQLEDRLVGQLQLALERLDLADRVPGEAPLLPRPQRVEVAVQQLAVVEPLRQLPGVRAVHRLQVPPPVVVALLHRDV